MEKVALVKRQPVWPLKMTNSICKKISDRMEPSQSALIIPSQLGKCAGPLPYNANPGAPASQRRWYVVLGLQIFRNLAEKK